MPVAAARLISALTAFEKVQLIFGGVWGKSLIWEPQ